MRTEHNPRNAGGKVVLYLKTLLEAAKSYTSSTKIYCSVWKLITIFVVFSIEFLFLHRSFSLEIFCALDFEPLCKHLFRLKCLKPNLSHCKGLKETRIKFEDWSHINSSSDVSSHCLQSIPREQRIRRTLGDKTPDRKRSLRGWQGPWSLPGWGGIMLSEGRLSTSAPGARARAVGVRREEVVQLQTACPSPVYMTILYRSASLVSPKIYHILSGNDSSATIWNRIAALKTFASKWIILDSSVSNSKIMSGPFSLNRQVHPPKLPQNEGSHLIHNVGAPF